MRAPRHERGVFRVPFIVSALLHALLLVFSPPDRPDPPKERIMELALVQRGDGNAPSAATAAAETRPTPKQQSKAVETTPPAPQGVRPKAPESTPQAPPATPSTFAEWSQNQRSAVPSMATLPADGGGQRGRDLSSSRGRKKCAPFHQRRVDVVYLLFDSSGSMSPMRHSQALGCAHQYAKAAMDSGAWVIVGNFAASTHFSQPTRNMTDVEIALRGPSDARATILPTKGLGRLFDHNPRAVGDMVIVSDGYIINYNDLLPSYRYFLELNPNNRGYMYTVGSPGHPAVTRALEEIGFDVYIYQTLY